MIKANCICGVEIKERGALLFSKPEIKGNLETCIKIHICDICFNKTIALLNPILRMKKRKGQTVILDNLNRVVGSSG